MNIQQIISEWNTPLGFIAALIAIGGLIWGVMRYCLYQYKKFKEPVDVHRYLKSLKLREEYKIAIVDDEIDDFPIQYLRSLDYKVSTFESISLNEVDKLLNFDMIFLDVKGVVQEDMETGGAKLLKLIKKAKPSVMVIAVSSGKYQLSLNSFFENSDDVLNKPIREENIERSISDLIDSNIDVDMMTEKLSDMIACSKSKQEKLINKCLIKFFSGAVTHEELCNTIHVNTNHKYSEKISTIADKIVKRINFDS